MFTLAANIILPLSVFGLVLSLWLLAVMYIDDRRRKLARIYSSREPQKTAATSEESLWLDDRINAPLIDELVQISDIDRESRTRKRRLFVVVLFLATFIWILFSQFLFALACGTLAYVLASRLYSIQSGRKAADEQEAVMQALRMASRTLRAGHSLFGMLEILARETPGTVGRVFIEVVHRMDLGDDPNDAIREVLLVSPIRELRIFGVTLLVQSRTGGDLAHITDRLSKSMDENNRVLRKARTLLAYGRGAALTIVVTFVLVVGIVLATEATYRDFLMKDPSGHVIVSLSIILIALSLYGVQRYARAEIISTRPAS